MTPDRIILHDKYGGGSLCVDDTGEGVLITTVGDEQVLLTEGDYARFREWLIKRANEGGGDTA